MWPKISLNYSPNFKGIKRLKKNIKFIIIHYTGMQNELSALNRLCDIKTKVSAHYLIKKNGLESHFNFLGSYPSKEMPIFFSHADALLVSLKKSKIFSLTIPAKIQSYLACGKPIIASLDGEGAKIVEKAECGLVSPAENSVKLGENIKKIMSWDKSKLDKIGSNGATYYRKEFDRNFLLDRLESIFRSD